MTDEERLLAAGRLVDDLEGSFGGGLPGALDRYEVARLVLSELRSRFLAQVLRSRVRPADLSRMLGVSRQRGAAVVKQAEVWGQEEQTRRRREEYRLAKERERKAAGRRAPKPLAELEGAG